MTAEPDCGRCCGGSGWVTVIGKEGHADLIVCEECLGPFDDAAQPEVRVGAACALRACGACLESGCECECHAGRAVTREEAEHARICSLPFGHRGGHWWDEAQEPPPTVQDALIRRWQEEAAQLDAQAARARAAGESGRFQIHGWETRAQALRDCATELWQLATEEARDG